MHELTLGYWRTQSAEYPNSLSDYLAVLCSNETIRIIKLSSNDTRSGGRRWASLVDMLAEEAAAKLLLLLSFDDNAQEDACDCSRSEC